ncbi:MAG: hypothetical protein MZV63_07840 [Marinilabiliales bacterium]|nr:hypothetical protein [Marinilabiliales bacterium]
MNDAITLTITLKGSGNLNLAGEPVINFPQGIEKYDPKVTVKSSGALPAARPSNIFSSRETQAPSIFRPYHILCLTPARRSMSLSAPKDTK